MRSRLGRYEIEYCRAEAMSVWVLGVIRCRAVGKNQRNLLCLPSRGTERSSFLVFQCEGAPSVLGNKYLYWTLSLLSKNQPLMWLTKIPVKNYVILGSCSMSGNWSMSLHRGLGKLLHVWRLNYRSGSVSSCHSKKIWNGSVTLVPDRRVTIGYLLIWNLDL
jgi:hypothetical protein